MKTAHKLQKMGRNGDTLLAHINPQEAHLLKSVGGSGTRNPKTGLLEFSFGDGIQADPGDPNSGGGTFGGGEVGLGGGLDAFAGYGGMLGGVQPAVEDPFNLDMMALDKQLAPNYAQPPTIGPAPVDNALAAKDLLGFLFGGIKGKVDFAQKALNSRGWSNNTSFNMPGDQVSRGNGFDGGNLPNDNATTPGGQSTNPATPTTPAANPYTYNRPAFTPTFGQSRGAYFTNPYSRSSGAAPSSMGGAFAPAGGGDGLAASHLLNPASASLPRLGGNYGAPAAHTTDARPPKPSPDARWVQGPDGGYWTTASRTTSPLTWLMGG